MDTNASRELLIPRQMDDLQVALESLEKDIESLSARLGKVSSPVPKQETQATPVPSFPCDYAEALAGKVRMVRRLREVVASPENHLEL